MPALSRDDFLKRYGRYFNPQRIQGIQDLGFFFVEGPAEGPWFQDAEGNRFLDMWCMGGLYNLGHRHPVLMDVARKAFEEEDFGSLFFFSEAKGKLAEKLASCSPGAIEPLSDATADAISPFVSQGIPGLHCAREDCSWPGPRS